MFAAQAASLSVKIPMAMLQQLSQQHGVAVHQMRLRVVLSADANADPSTEQAAYHHICDRSWSVSNLLAADAAVDDGQPAAQIAEKTSAVVDHIELTVPMLDMQNLSQAVLLQATIVASLTPSKPPKECILAQLPALLLPQGAASEVVALFDCMVAAAGSHAARVYSQHFVSFARELAFVLKQPNALLSAPQATADAAKCGDDPSLQLTKATVPTEVSSTDLKSAQQVAACCAVLEHLLPYLLTHGMTHCCQLVLAAAQSSGIELIATDGAAVAAESAAALLSEWFNDACLQSPPVASPNPETQSIRRRPSQAAVLPTASPEAESTLTSTNTESTGDVQRDTASSETSSDLLGDSSSAPATPSSNQQSKGHSSQATPVGIKHRLPSPLPSNQPGGRHATTAAAAAAEGSNKQLAKQPPKLIRPRIVHWRHLVWGFPNPIIEARYKVFKCGRLHNTDIFGLCFTSLNLVSVVAKLNNGSIQLGDSRAAQLIILMVRTYVALIVLQYMPMLFWRKSWCQYRELYLTSGLLVSSVMWVMPMTSPQMLELAPKFVSGLFPRAEFRLAMGHLVIPALSQLSLRYHLAVAMARIAQDVLLFRVYIAEPYPLHKLLPLLGFCLSCGLAIVLAADLWTRHRFLKQVEG